MSQPQLQIEEEEITICAIPAPLLRVKADLPDGTSASVADRIGSHLWRACKHAAGQQSPTTLLDGIANGEDLLLLALEGTDILGVAIITRQVFQTGKNSIFIRVVSGDRFAEWRDKMNDEIEKIGIEVDCSSIITCGRVSKRGHSGWVKHNAEMGYKPIHTTFEKQLDRGNA